MLEVRWAPKLGKEIAVPTIRLTDNASLDILIVQANEGSGLAKYFRGIAAAFTAGDPLKKALNQSIKDVTSSPIGLGMTFKDMGEFGVTGVNWTLQAGARAGIDVTQAGQGIPGYGVFGEAPKVGDGKTHVSVAFSPTLSVDLAQYSGDLGFGFSAGGTVEFRAGRAFDVTGKAPSLQDALKDLLASGIVPGDLADLQKMKTGDTASMSGSGEVQVWASFDVARFFNPLATVNLPLGGAGKIAVSAGGSISVGASVGIRGKYQIRVMKLDEKRVQLGVYKLAGKGFEFTVNAEAGIRAVMGRKELIARLMKLMGATEADAEALAEAGLSDAQIADLQDAVESSINRSLAVSLSGSFAVSTDNSTIFEYEFELERLDAAGKDALHRALRADLSKLTSVKPDGLPVGIKMLRSELERVREKSVTWKLNLLGIVNVLHVTSLVLDGKVLYDPQTGELLVTDSATAKNIRVATNALQAEPARLRKAMMQSAVLTAAYRASGLQKCMEMEGSFSYFEQVADATRPKVSDFADNLLALDLISDREKIDFLKHSFAGRASVLAEISLDNPAFERMFRNPDGSARKQEDFDQIGRKAAALLVQPGDEDEYRRVPMLSPESDKMWREMSDAGPFNLQHVVPHAISKNAVQLAMLQHDYTVIKWWSKAMSVAAGRIAEMREFLRANGQDAEALKDNNDFKKRRAVLEKALGEVVSESVPDFLSAWGEVAMYLAAGKEAGARGMVITGGATLARSRERAKAAAG